MITCLAPAGLPRLDRDEYDGTIPNLHQPDDVPVSFLPQEQN
jgi:hypothetical protein